MPYKHTVQEELCSGCDLCTTKCYPSITAIRGLDGLFPHQQDESKRRFGNIQAAGEQFLEGTPRFLALRDTVFVPNLLGTPRVAKMKKVEEEPLYCHANTKSKLGGFNVDIPLVIAAMGSTDIANLRGIDAGIGAAKTGTIYVIGENIINMRGYDKRIKKTQPTLKERMMGFLKYNNGKGGVLVQQNVEDSKVGVWKTVYADPDMKEYFKAGLIGFEAKGGQGAKPGMGGEVKIDRELAIKLKDKYHFPVDPEKVEQKLYQRHSVPGTMTVDSMKELIKTTIADFPEAKLWFKTGPYGDLMTQIEVLDEAAQSSGQRINITIDGTEGGTGMSPLGPMNEMGIPTLVCLELIAKAKEEGFTHIDYTITGGLFRGDHLAKAMILGADAMAIGRAANIAIEAGRKAFANGKTDEKAITEAGGKGLANYFNAIADNARMLVSSLGKYDLAELHEQPIQTASDIIKSPDLMALNKEVAKMFGIIYAHDPDVWNKITEVNKMRRDRWNK